MCNLQNYWLSYEWRTWFNILKNSWNNSLDTWNSAWLNVWWVPLQQDFQILKEWSRCNCTELVLLEETWVYNAISFYTWFVSVKGPRCLLSRYIQTGKGNILILIYTNIYLYIHIDTVYLFGSFRISKYPWATDLVFWIWQVRSCFSYRIGDGMRGCIC